MPKEARQHSWRSILESTIGRRIYHRCRFDEGEWGSWLVGGKWRFERRRRREERDGRERRQSWRRGRRCGGASGGFPPAAVDTAKRAGKPGDKVRNGRQGLAGSRHTSLTGGWTGVCVCCVQRNGLGLEREGVVGGKW